MTELSPETRAFIDEAVAQDQPDAADRARVRAALAASLAVGAIRPTTLGAKLAAGVLAVTAGGALVVALATRHAATPTPPAPVPPPPALAAPARPVLPAPPAPVLPAAPAPAATRPMQRPASSAPATALAPVPVPVPAPAAPADTLQEEVRLLSAAKEALEAHQPQRAMAALDEHAARFPGGALAQERRAVHILALCALGRDAEARAEAEAFVAEAPSSPLLGRVRDSCAMEGL